MTTKMDKFFTNPFAIKWKAKLDKLQAKKVSVRCECGKFNLSVNRK